MGNSISIEGKYWIYSTLNSIYYIKKDDYSME